MGNPIQDFINGIVATSQATAKKANMSPGQFGENVASGVGDLVGGAVNLVNPMSPTNPVRVAIQHPEQVAPMTKQFIEQLGTSLNNTVGQPVNPKTMQFQTPSLSEAETFAYNKPVDVAANVAMGAGAAAKVAKAGAMLGDAGEAGKAGAVGDVAKSAIKPKSPAGFQSEGMKQAGLPPIGGGMNLVPKTKAEIEAPKVPDVPQNVKATFLKNFTVPAKVADKINMDKAANTVIADGIKPDFQSLQKAKDTITGGNGEFPKLIYRALGDVKEPVDVSSIMKQGFDRIASVPELADAPGKLQAFQDVMKNLFPQKDMSSSITGSTDTMDAWDAMQQLERRGYAYSAKSHYLTNNPYYEDLGKAFTDTAQDLQDMLESKLKGIDMSKYETPEMRNNLQNVSPNLLKRYDAMPKTIDNIRGIQKPYVDLGTMMRQTNAASHTAFSNASAMAAKAIGSAAGGAAGTPAGAMGIGAGALIGNSVISPIVEPLLRAAIEKYGPGVQLAGAKFISNFGKGGMPGMPGIPGAVKPSLPGISAAALNQPGQETPGAVQSKTGTQTITQQAPGNITPFYQNIKSDSTGHFQINTAVDPANKPMTYQDFVSQTAGLSPNDPEYTKIKNQYDMEQSLIKNGIPENVQGFMRNAVPIQRNANIIADKIGDGTFPMGLINHFDNLTDAAKYVDPKYQGFVTGLDGLNNGFEELYQNSTGTKPSSNMLISPKDSQQQAEAKIAYMTNFFSGTYDEYKGIYSALSPSGDVSAQTGQIQAAAVPKDNTPSTGVNPLLMQQNFPSVAPLGQ